MQACAAGLFAERTRDDERRCALSGSAGRTSLRHSGRPRRRWSASRSLSETPNCVRRLACSACRVDFRGEHAVDLADLGEAALERHAAHALREQRAADSRDVRDRGHRPPRRLELPAAANRARLSAGEVEAVSAAGAPLVGGAGGRRRRAAPRFASCSAATPSPEADAADEQHSPLQPPLPHQHVVHDGNASGTAAAASIASPLGTGIASRASITANSEQAPAQRPITCCPIVDAAAAFAERDDLARALDPGGPGRAALDEAAGDELAAVQAGRAHAQQHLPASGSGVGDRPLQHDPRAVDADPVRLQGRPTSTAMAYSAQPRPRPVCCLPGLAHKGMALLGKAASAMWWDIAPDVRADFEDWHAHEHFPERLSMPGFRRGTRWSDASGGEGMFVMYELEGHRHALASPEYLARLNAPSPWSTR